jgi:hypothetical protein
MKRTLTGMQDLAGLNNVNVRLGVVYKNVLQTSNWT